MRLNAYISSCGIASRRKSEIIILEGRVQVNNKIVLAPFFQVDPDNDLITLDKKVLKPSELVYYVLNKPSGYVCAVTDKYDPVVVDLITDFKGRLYPVGRLDRDSEGLLILTNDGNFTQNISHPSKEIHKEYEALLNIPINSKQLQNWRNGFIFSDGRKIVPVNVHVLNKSPANQWISITIAEGLKHEVKLMAQLAGFKVIKLFRRKIGKLKLQNLNSGEFIRLSFSQLYSKILNGGLV